MDKTLTSVSGAVEQLRGEALELLDKLSSVPANPSTGEGYEQTVAIIADYLESAGIEAELIDVPRDFLLEDWGTDLNRSKEYIGVEKFAPRKIVVARLEGETPELGVHLTHNYDLWVGVREERAGTVAQLVALKALKQSGVHLGESIFFSATPDGHLGAETGAGYLAESRIGECKTVITGNPGGVDTVTLGYKGKLWGKITVRGKASHSARPDEGVNAIDQMSIVQKHLKALDDSLRKSVSTWPVVPEDAKRATLTVCRIESNEDGILVPDSCSIHIDRRVNPDENLEEAEREIREVLAAASAEMEYEPELVWLRTVESSGTSPESDLVRLLDSNISTAVGTTPNHAVWPNYGGFRYFLSEWGATTAGYNPGKPVNGKASVSDDEMIVGTEVLALSLLEIVSKV